MKLLTLYLEKVPTTDKVCGKTFNVIAWEDKEKTKKKCVWPWYQKSRPDKRNKTVTVNCYQWNIEWIN
jgi:hypothetical protein